MIVDQKGWMTSQEFNEAFALAQFLPGPNVVNFSVVFGARFGGAAGAATAFLGLMLPPLVIVVVLAMLYARYGDLAALSRTLAGVTCAAVGLLIASLITLLSLAFGNTIITVEGAERIFGVPVVAALPDLKPLPAK